MYWHVSLCGDDQVVDFFCLVVLPLPFNIRRFTEPQVPKHNSKEYTTTPKLLLRPKCPVFHFFGLVSPQAYH